MDEILRLWRESVARHEQYPCCEAYVSWGEFLVLVNGDSERFGETLACEASRALCDLVKHAPAPA